MLSENTCCHMLLRGGDSWRWNHGWHPRLLSKASSGAMERKAGNQQTFTKSYVDERLRFIDLHWLASSSQDYPMASQKLFRCLLLQSSGENPPYSYYSFYIYVNLCRRDRGSETCVRFGSDAFGNHPRRPIQNRWEWWLGLLLLIILSYCHYIFPINSSNHWPTWVLNCWCRWTNPHLVVGGSVVMGPD